MTEISAANVFVVLYIVDSEGRARALYTLNTRHGELVLVFLPTGGEQASFESWAQSTLKAGFRIATAIVVASGLEQLRGALAREGLPIRPTTKLILEGTRAFNDVIRELEDDTIWPDA